jgi:hypothetical protein
MINQAINRPEVVVDLKVRERAPQMTLEMAACPTNERNVSSILWDISYATYVSRVVGMLQGKSTIPILCAVRTQPARLSEHLSEQLLRLLVDLIGIEPMTSSMPWKRAPSCATGPLLGRTVSILADCSTFVNVSGN